MTESSVAAEVETKTLIQPDAPGALARGRILRALADNEDMLKRLAEKPFQPGRFGWLVQALSRMALMELERTGLLPAAAPGTAVLELSTAPGDGPPVRAVDMAPRKRRVGESMEGRSIPGMLAFSVAASAIPLPGAAGPSDATLRFLGLEGDAEMIFDVEIEPSALSVSTLGKARIDTIRRHDVAGGSTTTVSLDDIRDAVRAGKLEPVMVGGDPDGLRISWVEWLLWLAGDTSAEPVEAGK